MEFYSNGNIHLGSAVSAAGSTRIGDGGSVWACEYPLVRVPSSDLTNKQTGEKCT